jgi:hypothetical protein
MGNQVLYGFTNLKDVFSQRVEDVGVQVINDAIDATLAEHNKQLNDLMSLFVDTTTQYKVRYKTPGAASLQPMDESGRARPIKVSGYYDIAFPLQMGGIAWGNTYLASQKMLVEDANATMATIVTADKRWMRDRIMAAMLTNVNYTFADPAHGDLTVKPLANADTDTYLIQAGTDAGTTDSHYLAQAGAIADASDPFPTIYTELTEHPENSGDVVAFVPTSNKAAVEGLSGFYPTADSNLQIGSGATVLSRTLNVTMPGQLFGYHESGVWLAEWKGLPANYLIATMTGGPRPVAMREEPEASLRGFNRVAGRDNYPFYESQYLRIAGFGIQNRVGALVYRVGGAPYAIPTNYTAPLA